MPYTIRKVPNQPCYRVYNRNTKKVFAKCATKENANKQLRLLRGLEFNKTFRAKFKARSKTMKRRSS